MWPGTMMRGRENKSMANRHQLRLNATAIADHPIGVDWSHDSPGEIGLSAFVRKPSASARCLTLNVQRADPLLVGIF